jgi:YNFM family putative membrane transporter
MMMFGFAAGFFFIHSTLSGLVNHLAREHKGVVNGLYVSIYYISGALGSWLPGYLYDHAGWNSLILVFSCVLILTAWLVGQLRPTGHDARA